MLHSYDLRNNIGIIRVESERCTAIESAAIFDLIEKKLNEPDVESIVIDLTAVSFIDSNFLGTLVKGLKLAMKNHGELAVCGLQPPVKSMFELTRLYNIFKIYSTSEEAVQALKTV
ncbi:MAG: STAS domain-containing protein [Balneolales bacterium]|nr:STAS domain-containing protein [Balneolales bacterium]